MAEVLTALGAAAAASQFLQQAVALTLFFHQTFSDIKDAPQTVQANLAQIEQLIDISTLIQTNLALQTDAVASLLQACFRDSTKLQKQLKSLTPRPGATKLDKLGKAFVATLKSSSIERLMQSLDRHKLSLVIAIDQIDSSKLHEIGLQLAAAQGATGDLLLLVKDTNHQVRTTVDVLSQLSDQVTAIDTKLPELSGSLHALRDEDLPLILSLLKDNQNEKLDSISGCSKKAQGTFAIPTRRTRRFLGREGLLRQLKNDLTPKSASMSCAVLRALGGQGKSSVALEYCLRTRNDPYVTILWIDATSNKTIRRAFELFYRRFAVQSDALLDDVDGIVAFVRDSFERMSKPWLMVFDNYDDPAEADIQDYMPLSKVGSILITSRRDAAKALASPGLGFELEALSEPDAIELLLSSARMESEDQHEGTAKQIVSLLSNHALAIVQAGAFIAKSKLPLDQFLPFYNGHREAVLSSGLPVTDYDRKSAANSRSLDVFATWELSFRQLTVGTGKNRFKEDILTVLAFFEGIEISEQPLKTFCTNIEAWDSAGAMARSPGSFLADHLRCWDSQSFADILAEFFDCALIQSYDRGRDGYYRLSFHPLVKDWIRHRTGVEKSQEYQILVTEILVEFLNPSKSDGRNMTAAITDVLSSSFTRWEGDAVTDDSESNVSRLKALLEVKESLSLLTLDSGHYKDAWKQNQNITILVEKLYGADHLETIRAKYSLALCAEYLGRNDEALAIVRSIQEKAAGLSDTHGALRRSIVMLIALTLRDTAQFEEAEALLEGQLRAERKLYGEDSMAVVSVMISLGQSYEAQGKDEQALKVFSHVRTQWPAEFENLTERLVLEVLNATATILWRQGDLNGALEILEKVWRGVCENSAQSRPENLNFLLNIAFIKMRQGLYAESEEKFKRALESLAPNVGLDHLVALRSACVFAECLQMQGKLVEAESPLRAAIHAHALGGNPETVDSLRPVQRLAAILRSQGKLDEAEESAMQALNSYRLLLGPAHKETLATEAILNSITKLKAGSLDNTPAVGQVDTS